MKQLLMIMNPQAGTMKGSKYLSDIVSVFCTGGYEVIVAMTQGRGDGTVIARGRGSRADIVVAVGGDGTFNEVAAGILESGKKTVMGYIPAGSTNDFASSLGLSKGVVQAAHDIVNGKVYPIDMGSFNGRYFSYVASFGAFTSTSYNVSQSLKNTMGHMAYILAGIRDVFSLKSYELEIENQGKKFGGKYIFGAICNSTSMGGILTLDRSLVDLNDGKFEVLLIKFPGNLIELNQVVMALTAQNYQDCPMFEFFRTSDIRIRASEDMDWTLDGEFQKGAGKIEIRNDKSALNLVLPESPKLLTGN